MTLDASKSESGESDEHVFKRLIPYFVPIVLAMCVSGIIWSVNTQATQDAKLNTVIENQKVVMEKLDNRGDRIVKMEQQIIELDKELKRFRDLEDHRHGIHE